MLADSPGNIHAHLACAMPYCMSMEVSTRWRAAVFASDVRIEAGWAIAGDAPGNGLTIDPKPWAGRPSALTLT